MSLLEYSLAAYLFFWVLNYAEIGAPPRRMLLRWEARARNYNLDKLFYPLWCSVCFTWWGTWGLWVFGLVPASFAVCAPVITLFLNLGYKRLSGCPLE